MGIDSDFFCSLLLPHKFDAVVRHAGDPGEGLDPHALPAHLVAAALEGPLNGDPGSGYCAARLLHQGLESQSLERRTRSQEVVDDQDLVDLCLLIEPLQFHRHVIAQLRIDPVV